MLINSPPKSITTLAVLEISVLDFDFHTWLYDSIRIYEVRNAFEFEHPALPRVTHHFPEGNGQFLVMDFGEGTNLAQLLDSTGPPDYWKTLRSCWHTRPSLPQNALCQRAEPVLSLPVL